MIINTIIIFCYIIIIRWLIQLIYVPLYNNLYNALIVYKYDKNIIPDSCDSITLDQGYDTYKIYAQLQLQLKTQLYNQLYNQLYITLPK